MFGLYTLTLPSRLQNALHRLSGRQQGVHAVSVLVMGALSALVVSPCVSAPLAGALVFISSTGDKLVGASALFMLAIGMGLPLIAIGAGGGKLVPRAGAWMNQVKTLFGVLLLGMAIWLLSRVVPAAVSLSLWALLLIAYAVYSGALEPASEGWGRLRKAASFVLLFYGCLLLVGAITGASDPLRPLQAGGHGQALPQHQLAFTRINTMKELQAAMDQARAQQQPVMLDFYADWCTACLEMEKQVFSRSEVHDALQGYRLLQVDVTANSRDQQKILDSFGLFGPPAVMFFNPRGQEVHDQRIQGELAAADFIDHVRASRQDCRAPYC